MAAAAARRGLGRRAGGRSGEEGGGRGAGGPASYFILRWSAWFPVVRHVHSKKEERKSPPLSARPPPPPASRVKGAAAAPGSARLGADTGLGGGHPRATLGSGQWVARASRAAGLVGVRGASSGLWDWLLGGRAHSKGRASGNSRGPFLTLCITQLHESFLMWTVCTIAWTFYECMCNASHMSPFLWCGECTVPRTFSVCSPRNPF